LGEGMSPAPLLLSLSTSSGLKPFSVTINLL
jgi:hypothetical protein